MTAQTPPWCGWCRHPTDGHDVFGCRRRNCDCERAPADASGLSPVARPRKALTGRECDVLLHIAAGMTLAESGQVLGVGVSTTRSFARRVRAKLGGRNAAHTVALAYEAGMLGQRGDRCG